MKQGSRNKLRNALIAIGTTICFGTAITGCSVPGTSSKNENTKPTSKSTKLVTMQAKTGSIRVNVTGSGYMLPAKTTTLYYDNIYGTLKQFWIKENDEVKVGQPMVEIQTAELEKQIVDKEALMKRWPIKMMQLNEEISRIKTSMKLSKLNLDKAKKDKENYDSTDIAQLQLQYEMAVSSYKNSKWNKEITQIDYKNDKQNLSDLKTRISQNILKSKVNGIVVSVENLSENEVVNSGHILARVAEYKNMVFRMTTAQAEYISGISKATLTISNKAYQVSIYSPQPGDQLDMKTYSENGTELKNYIYLKFKETVPKLSISELTNVSLVVEKDNTITLPTESVYQEAGKNFVDIKAGNIVKPVEVVCGLEAEDKVEIVSGLKNGQAFVAR